MRDRKMRDWNYRHQTAGVENAGLEFSAPYDRGVENAALENSGTGNVWYATCGIT